MTTTTIPCDTCRHKCEPDQPREPWNQIDAFCFRGWSLMWVPRHCPDHEPGPNMTATQVAEEAALASGY